MRSSIEKRRKLNLKCVHFDHVHSWYFVAVNARAEGKALFYRAKVIFEELISSFKDPILTNAFQEIR